MRLLNIFSYVLLLATALGFQSCSDDDDNQGVATVLSVTQDGAEISSLAYPMGESTTVLAINTDGTWTASVPQADEEWLTITPHEGYGWAVNDETATNLSSYMKVTVARNTGETRSSTITITAGGLTKEVTVTQTGVSSGANDPIETAWDMIGNLGLGYNLGNTLEANPSGDWWDPTGKTPEDYETSWGQPVTTQEIIDDIYNAGFRTIRVPVTWYPHMDDNNQVDAAWMDRVQEVVDMVLSHEDAYCIINVMHDTGTEGWLYADEAAYPEQTVKYQALWQQIATRFRDYDGRLLFESFNEILNAERSWTAPDAGDGAYNAINMLQQDFVNTVRATGGNNEYRNLGITTYAATANTDAPMAALTVPTDVHANHIYATFHTYDPYNFCNDNGEYNILVFDASCQEEIDNVFNRSISRTTALGIPFVFGEFGAIDAEKDMNERVKYATYLGQKLRESGTTALWWMGLYDRNTHQWTEQSIVDALFAAYGN